MSLEASTYTKNRIANAELGAAAYTPPANIYIRLFSDVVSLAGVGDELDVDGYAAKQVANNTTNFPTTTTGSKANAVQIECAPLDEDSGDIQSIGIFDAATGGNLLYRKDFSSSPINIASGYFLVIPVGDLTLAAS